MVAGCVLAEAPSPRGRRLRCSLRAAAPPPVTPRRHRGTAERQSLAFALADLRQIYGARSARTPPRRAGAAPIAGPRHERVRRGAPGPPAHCCAGSGATPSGGPGARVPGRRHSGRGRAAPPTSALARALAGKLLARGLRVLRFPRAKRGERGQNVGRSFRTGSRSVVRPMGIVTELIRCSVHQRRLLTTPLARRESSRGRARPRSV